MRRLIIDEDVRYIIKKVVNYANRHELTLQDIKDTLLGVKQPVGDNVNHVCFIPDGHRVVYSIENQPSGKYKHISISIDKEGLLPNIEAIKTIIKEFDYEIDLDVDKKNVWVENEIAVNILEKID